MFWTIRPRASRAPPMAAVLGLSCAALVACDPKPESRPATPPAAAPAQAGGLTSPLPPPLGRAELLEAIAAARSAHAAGETASGSALADRRFAIRQPFGCMGEAQASQAGIASWKWGRDRETIEIALSPANWAGMPVFAPAGAGWEAVEGYWLTRPWLRTETCPAIGVLAAAQPEGAGPSAPNAGTTPTPLISGLAAVFARDSSRVGRRDGKAFTLTIRGEPPLAPPVNGYRLMLEGRLTSFADGNAIRCQAASVDHPPVCVAAAVIDRVVFEDADGKLLKEWRLG